MDSDRPGTYQIGELASRSGLTPDTLRYYERRGLLPAARRTGGGFRVYPAETLDRVRFIRQAQLLGLTLQDIADLVGYQDQGGVGHCRQVRDLLRARLSELQHKLAELDALKYALTGHLEACERALAAGTEPDRRGQPECPVLETLRTRE